MTDLTLGQKIRLGLGALALLRKHSDIIPELRAVAKDAFDLWDSVVPTAQTANKPIDEIIVPHLTPEERVQFDRASNPNAGGA